MKKVLFVANIYRHFWAFHIPYIKWFKEHGYEVHLAANDFIEIPYADKQWEICIERSPIRWNNIKAIYELRSIIKKENYSLITCHTPMGSVVARLAGMNDRRINNLKVIYMAHGFHFFKGSSFISWMFFYPIEKILSRYTDALITINTEDYKFIDTHNFKNAKSYLVSGIGINTERLIVATEEIKSSLRKTYGYKEASFILIYIAEYIPRKNHKFLISVLPDLIKVMPTLKLLLVGKGRNMDKMIEYSKHLGVYDFIDFLGYRNDVGQLIAVSDVGVSVSKSEGLGINIAEEMYSGLPVVCTRCRGHMDLVEDGVNGYLFSDNDKNQFIQCIINLYQNRYKCKELISNALCSIQKYTLERSLKEIEKIYKEFM